VEAAALTALYAWVVETFVYRDLKVFRDAPRVMTECGLLVGGVLLILGVSLGFTNYLVDAQIAERAVEWVTGSIHSRWVFLLLLNLFLLVVGCLMDIFSAIVVVVPLIIPIGVSSLKPHDPFGCKVAYPEGENGLGRQTLSLIAATTTRHPLRLEI